ncbi:MAG: peroxiredoxin Q/BCP [Vicingaceae bacterium]|jgi:peroxiredoxin Q/BCP
MFHLNIGDEAPEINAKDENGNNFQLSAHKGKKIVLYFYPKDSTPGCTTQACNLKDNYAELQKRGYEVVGVSADDEVKHQKFIAKYDLPFTLLADTDKKVIQDYGVWGLKKFMGKEYDGIHRTTFVIDEEGKIEEIIQKIKTKSHTEQILKD